METKKGPGKGNSPNSRKNLKPIQKGEVRNPAGARAHDPQMRELKKFTSQYLRDVIEAAVMGNLAGLKEIVEDPDAPAIQVGVARVIYKGVKDGDWDVIEKIIVRVLGKVPDKIDHTSNGQTIGGGLQVTFVEDGTE